MNATFFAPPLELDVQPDRTRAETDANASATPAVRVSFMVLSSLSSGYQDIVTATYNTRTATVPPHSPGCRQLRRDPLLTTTTLVEQQCRVPLEVAVLATRRRLAS